MGCCTNLAHFCRHVGIAPSAPAAAVPLLHDARPARQPLPADPLPAPLHLARSFLGAHYLSIGEKLRIAWGLACLRRSAHDADPPFLDWLRRTGKRRASTRFWGLGPDQRPERDARAHRLALCPQGLRGWLSPPSPRLRDRAADRAARADSTARSCSAWFEQRHGVSVRLNVRRESADREQRVQGSSCAPANRAGGLVRCRRAVRSCCWICCREVVERTTLLPEPANGWKPRRSPACICGTTGPSSTCRTSCWSTVSASGSSIAAKSRPGEHYVQVVVSAARQFRGLGHEEVAADRRRACANCSRGGADCPPASARGDGARGHVQCRARCGSLAAGADNRRWRICFLAGDWTATGWPATMEGAVRSGYLAAEAMLAGTRSEEKLVQPDL